ncbi:MAG: hypothetical protein ABF449_06250 [Ethanoligenens sp.]
MIFTALLTEDSGGDFFAVIVALPVRNALSNLRIHARNSFAFGWPDITHEMICEKGAIHEGWRWFKDNFQDGGEYQDVLNTLADQDRISDAEWLLNAFGPTKDFLVLEDLKSDHSILFAGSIKIRGSLSARFCICAGCGIYAWRSQEWCRV